MYNQRRGIQNPDSFTCPECASKRFRVGRGVITCTNCDYELKTARRNKYGARRTEAKDGLKRDSGFEASVADELYVRKRAGDILDYDSQFKVEVGVYREDGRRAFVVRHKVDFRVHHKDGSYELLEAKGVETADYKWRRRCLEELWLPLHPDYRYTVVKQGR